MGRGGFNVAYFIRSPVECVCLLIIAALLVVIMRVSWRYREANRMFTRYDDAGPVPPPRSHEFCTRWFCYDRREATTCTKGKK